MKTKKKPVNKAAQKKAEREQQEKRMKRVIWITGACIVVLVVLLLVIKPNSAKGDFDYSALPVLGNPDAPVKIVEMGDYKCPSCQYFTQAVSPELQKDYIDTGKAALYFMNYLIISPDADSMTAALAAQSVFHQNKDEFWKYYDAIYKNQGDETTEWATPDFLVNLARTENIKVDYDKLRKDIDDKTYKKEVESHNETARSLHVMSTPTLFVNGEKASEKASMDYTELKPFIESKLAEQNTK
ncbi:thioredoxin domain-containing protein [Paenibacillus sp. HJL G12]|uniref:Thioredoxin domain-containing protein n=1 Tax=Paenibacillus dendrobii TaxID=2691084 RepID=A0A7X3LI00_9BACL|nr:thioredoxin domain-containing protein [Paenibacillus dendrobii]MWV45622.1 thioredoxin domain-containing protein [Paenibacillus dendrobii]